MGGLPGGARSGVAAGANTVALASGQGYTLIDARDGSATVSWDLL